MGKKDNKKEQVQINDTVYTQVKQVRKEDNLEQWLFIPKLEEGQEGSGLHIFGNGSITQHYDFFKGKEKLEIKEPTNISGLGGVWYNAKKGEIFAIPKDMIWIINNKGIKKFIAKEEYEKNKDKYEIVDIKGGLKSLNVTKEKKG